MPIEQLDYIGITLWVMLIGLFMTSMLSIVVTTFTPRSLIKDKMTWLTAFFLLAIISFVASLQVAYVLHSDHTFVTSYMQ